MSEKQEVIIKGFFVNSAPFGHLFIWTISLISSYLEHIFLNNRFDRLPFVNITFRILASQF